MQPLEFLVGGVLVLVLLVLSSFARFQWKQLQRSRTAQDLRDDERRFLRSQARRRLVCSALLFLLALFLIGTVYLEPYVQQIYRYRDLGLDELPPEQKRFARFYALYWMIALVVLFGVFVCAIADLWAIQRFNLRERRRMLAERRVLLEQLASDQKAKRDEKEPPA